VRARAEVLEIERTAREALTEVRATVSGWRQASLEAELDAARGALASTGVSLVVHRDPDLTLVGSMEHALALAVREAITNVARHARARACHVRIYATDGELQVVVADDGIGGTSLEGNGLSGMRERIAALGGRVVRTGTEGTTVTIAVPLRVAT
jgi:two-component system sensor histidine kinase DesK